MIYDVIIVGAGPAGLLAGCVLKENNIKFLIIEKGKPHFNRDRQAPFDVSSGFGGAGLFSDGKLSYAPSASKLWSTLEKNKLRESYLYLKTYFDSLGIKIKEWSSLWTKTIENNKYKKYDSQYLSFAERHSILNSTKKILDDELVLGETVSIIKQYDDKFQVISDNKRYESKNVLIAAGKSSNLNLFSSEMQIKTRFCAEMGFRIESENKYFLPEIEQQVDYKIIDKIDANTEIRTFCCCKNGQVRKSLYNDNLTFNGERDDSDSQYSNIGIVVRTLDENSIYAKEMSVCLQQKASHVISFDGLEKGVEIIGNNTDLLLKNMMPQLLRENSDGVIYGPEIERFGYYPVLDNNLRSSTNLYFIGDATGLFRGLMAAFISGVYVSKVICEKAKKEKEECMDKLKIKQSNTEDMKLIFTAQSKAFFYCRDVVCQYVLEQGMLPLNPFRVFDYFLSDRVDRNLIRRGNNQLIRKCEELWVFGQIADGVLFEIASAIEQGKKVRFFSIGTRVEDIVELNVEQVSFEPEVHSRKVKKKDLIKFIKTGKIEKLDNQMSIFDYIDK